MISIIQEWIEKTILAFPKDLHPMTQFSMAILACQKESQFAAAYQKGVKKGEYWKYCYEDMITCIARLPRIGTPPSAPSLFHSFTLARYQRVNS
jgi:citrate synthase